MVFNPTVMGKEKARKQALERLHEWRKQIVRSHKKAMRVMQVVSLTKLRSYPQIDNLTIRVWEP